MYISNECDVVSLHRTPWNKVKLLGQKPQFGTHSLRRTFITGKDLNLPGRLPGIEIGHAAA
jgi:hypothetical protein